MNIVHAPLLSALLALPVAAQGGPVSQPASPPPASADKPHQCKHEGHTPDQCPHKGQKGHDHHHGAHHTPGAMHKEGMHAHHRFDNAEKWAEHFDAAERAAWQKPDAVIDLLALSDNAHVADIGSATGYFAARIAKRVPNGHVWGVDIEPDMVRYLNDRAQKEGLTNLVSTLGAADNPQLTNPVDVVLVVDTYHHIADRTAYFERLRNQIKPGGVVAIVDFKDHATPHGPPPKMRLSAQQVIDELQPADYSLMLLDETTLPEQYVLVFKANAKN